MATIKSFTNLSQSKKLAEILSPESADMLWGYWYNGENHCVPNMRPFIDQRDNIPNGYIPAWSLAALLEQLKSEIILENKQILFLHINKYDDIDYEIRYTNSWTGEVFIAEADNLVDTCVTMIEKLHELNLL